MGKTRLVEEWLASHQPGRFVDLTSVRTLDEACARAADRLEVSGAARLTMISPATLRDRLRDRLLVLSRGPADAPTRQASLASAITWSWGSPVRGRERDPAERGGAAPGDIRRRRTLILQVQGGWFQVEDAAPVSCSRWKLLQRRSWRSRARVDQPGHPVTARTLLAAGWPDESIMARAARNRLHVALHRLRRLGLHEVIVCETGGWLLSRQFDLELRDVPCPERETSG